jgi:HD superfamily phosphodiesterase
MYPEGGEGKSVCLDRAIEEMKRIFKDVPYGIEHTNRVLNNTAIIMDGESVDDTTRLTVSLAAVLHDIGTIEARKKHGSLEGCFQEIEGPPVARSIMERAGVPPEISDRVCSIVGNHHTPGKIDGLDFQILWEADYLELLLFDEDGKDPASLRLNVAENFRTAAGRRLARARLKIP